MANASASFLALTTATDHRRTGAPMSHSPTCLLMTLTALALAAAAVTADDWHAAAGPLMTQWAKEVTPEHVLEEYPRPTLVRTAWQSLNGLWDYQVTPKGDERRPESYGGRIMVPFPIESALSGVMKAFLPDQRLWYRRHFTVPAAWLKDRIVLRFGAVDWSTEVFVDGTSLGSHRGGYDAFAFDLNRALRGDGEHELVVSVTDPNDSGWQLRGKQSLHPGGAFYTASSGIWQTVWLEPVPHSAIEALHPLADLAKGVLRLEVTTRTRPEAMTVRATVSDSGTTVASAELAVNAEIRGDVKENLAWYKATAVGNQVTIELPIAQPKTWTPESPFLYDLAVELRDKDGALLDTVQSYAALRTIEVGHRGPNTVPLLNGKPIILQGALEQGFWPDGLYTAPSDAALRFDVEAAKKLGLNTVRKHIKVEPERYYSWCDRLGLMVIQDFPSGREGDSFTDQPTMPEAASVCEMERRILLQQRWNHPSIVCWAMFNEGWGQHDTLHQVHWARELDPNRLIDEASGFPRHGFGDVLDCHGGIPPRDANRISIDSETCGFGLTVPGHSWPGKGWATGTYDPKADAMTTGAYDALYPLDEHAKRWYTRELVGFYRFLPREGERTGMSGNFKVQLYDLENECNGMLSYDRAVWKVDPAAISAACRGK
jgi:Glycosyl hydrolases family 2, sugar binding domain/Glycosyl hydrolases family 2, TIM barrel domain/Glycosyl hydrolases family 2